VTSLTAADPERGIDWKHLRELVESTSDDDLQAATSDYPWSAIVEIRSLLLEVSRLSRLAGRRSSRTRRTTPAGSSSRPRRTHAPSRS
jgi:hypothetical protein